VQINELPQGSYPISASSRIQTCILPFVINDRKQKQLEGRFSQLLLPHQLAVSHLMVMSASFQNHCKFLSDNRGCYKYNRSLFPEWV